MTTPSIALVTGANKGIGFAIARSLAQHGMTVLLGARDPGRRAKAAAELAAAPPPAQHGRRRRGAANLRHQRLRRAQGHQRHAAPAQEVGIRPHHLGIDIPRTAADGATIAVELATAPPGGPTGGFFNEAGPVPW